VKHRNQKTEGRGQMQDAGKKQQSDKRQEARSKWIGKYPLLASCILPLASVGKNVAALAFLALALSPGCHSDMYDQPRGKPLAQSRFFQNGQVARPLVEGTVPREEAPEDELLLTGRMNGQLSDTFPFRVTKEVLDRGHERFNVYCTPCHGPLGDGKGMIVQRGFPAPPSFHSDTLRAKPVGHYVDVITHGIGKMFPYADRVQPHDRWAIAAYIRALQLSQNAAVRDLSDAQRRPLAGK